MLRGKEEESLTFWKKTTDQILGMAKKQNKILKQSTDRARKLFNLSGTSISINFHLLFE